MNSSEVSAAPNVSEFEPKGVFVSSISPSADNKTINDFFSFCGKIARLSLQPTPNGGGAQESVVVFESESAAKTALLLTNAMIVDRSIKVEPLLLSKASPPKSSEMAHGDIKHKAFDVHDNERSKTSVVASLLAAGYGVGSDTLSKAKEYDDKHMVTLSLKAGVAQVQARAHEIDEQYKISENVQALANKVTSTVAAVDESVGFSKTVTAGYNTAKNATVAAGNVVAAKAMSNETIASSVKKVQETATAATGAVSQKYNELKSETTEQIEARKAAQPHNDAAAVTPGDAQATSSAAPSAPESAPSSNDASNNNNNNATNATAPPS